MQNMALDIVENLFLANEVFIGKGARLEAFERRLELQHQAMTRAKVLAYVALLAREQVCITPSSSTRDGDGPATGSVGPGRGGPGRGARVDGFRAMCTTGPCWRHVRP